MDAGRTRTARLCRKTSSTLSPLSSPARPLPALFPARRSLCDKEIKTTQAFESNWGFLCDKEGAKGKLEARVRSLDQLSHRRTVHVVELHAPWLACRGREAWIRALRPLERSQRCPGGD